ncbi:DEAD/DEAH box helicase family protein [Pseudomonas sp.]|uniref:DEAD/DEAH box helicase family protein n=1 Tax=Pseudomonas sp. TaxID=306 RepID=UPI003FD8370E
MTNKIELLDSIMGSGKSTAVLNWCEQNPNTTFLYVTPLLSESEVRVVEACTQAKFIAPSTEDHRTKGEHLLDLLQSGVNISITHVLYSSLRKEHLHWMKENKYTLILDEEVSFIEPLGDGYTSEDFQYLRELKQIDVLEDGKLVWLNESVGANTKYTKLANMCRLGMVYQSKRSENWFVTQLPMDLILCAERVILLTYLFKGSILDSFLSMKGIEVVTFTEVQVLEKSKKDIISLIEFIGEKQVVEWSSEALSSSWYGRSTQKELTKLAKSIRAIGNAQKVLSDDLLWCTPASVGKPTRKGMKKVSPISYAAGSGEVQEDGIASGCFLSCTSRATNAYRDRSVLVHCYNRFPHLSVSSFLQDYGTRVDANQFALSELVQWVWRSQIRDGKPIKICILSKRMRKLFQDWLHEELK